MKKLILIIGILFTINSTITAQVQTQQFVYSSASKAMVTIGKDFESWDARNDGSFGGSDSIKWEAVKLWAKKYINRPGIDTIQYITYSQMFSGNTSISSTMYSDPRNEDARIIPVSSLHGTDSVTISNFLLMINGWINQ